MTFGLSAAAIGGIATVGSAAIGAISSKKAADRGAKAAERGQDILAQSREQGRADVMAQFPKAQEAQTRGFEEFRDFVSGQVMPQQVAPFMAGNMAAQEQVVRGLPQIQNAILGNAIDTSGFQARQIGQAPSFDIGKYQTPETSAPVFDPSKIDLSKFNLDLGIGSEQGFNPYRPIGVSNRFKGMNIKERSSR
jgi:hypothetical protein